ncbi:hypothetical protein SBY92_001276 [Candida maltosa Xu316]
MCNEPSIQYKCDYDIYITGLCNRFSLPSNKPATIKSIPTSILLDICSYLQQDDLINLALSSKQWTFPAIKVLFSKVIVTDDMNSISSVKKAVSKCSNYLGTVISISKFQELLISLNSNPQLAAMLKTLVLNVNEEVINLIPMLSTVKGLQLRTLIAPQIPISYFTKGNRLDMSKIKTLGVSVRDVGSEPLCFPQLESLKIYYTETHQDSKNLRRLGKLLRKGKSLRNLHELEFAEHPYNTTLALLNIINNDIEAETLPAWIHFFDYIIKGKVPKKLSLDSLAIKGFIGDKAVQCVAILTEAIELNELFNLQLHIKEQSPSHHDTTGQFLDLITQKTTSLESLAIAPTSACLISQQDSIIKTLSVNLRQQLKNLVLVYESVSVKHAQAINETICLYQENLERLLINDKSTERIDRHVLLKCIQSDQNLLQLYDHGMAYEQMLIDLLFSDILLTDFLKLDDQFIINDHMIRLVEKTSGKGLNEFLWYFFHFNVSKAVANNFNLIERLPNLKYLNVLGISLVVRLSNGDLNPDLQELYDKTNGRFSILTSLIFRD